MTQPRNGRILVVDDEPDLRQIISAALEEEGHEVLQCGDGEAGITALSSESFDLAFVDINLPGLSGFDLLDRYQAENGETAIVIITGRATVANAIEATRRGAYDYVTKPFDLDALRILARRVLERQALCREIHQLKERARAEFQPGVEIVGQCAAMQEIYKLIGRVAASPATVMIQGESGTGKELIARAVHAYSERWQGPFVAVNCGAIPSELLESEMFGHERGAFTGAVETQIGKFEQACGGTFFLDEVSDMPPPLQAKLLRVLQEREFCRLGGHTVIRADCRIVAATNKILEREVETGRFREDLYFRLKVVVIDLPPLRERTADIPLLVEFFLQRINRQHHFRVHGVTPDAIALLAGYSWPGNVRELENMLIRSAALTPGRMLTAEDIPIGKEQDDAGIYESLTLEELVAAKISNYLASLGDVTPHDLHARMISTIEKPLIEATLELSAGNQLRAAEMLGINRNTLRKKITDLGIELRKERS